MRNGIEKEFCRQKIGRGREIKASWPGPAASESGRVSAAALKGGGAIAVVGSAPIATARAQAMAEIAGPIGLRLRGQLFHADRPSRFFGTRPLEAKISLSSPAFWTLTRETCIMTGAVGQGRARFTAARMGGRRW